jgi:DNA-binding LacI/PurR family transcriptional regulator
MAIESNGVRRAVQRSPSMADVARVAGVSAQTVSRVSNGHANVDDATRSRVLDAMNELGYRPNRAARALRSGRFHSIGVIMFTLSTFGNMRTLDAIATAAAAANYSVTLLPIPDPTLGTVAGAYSRLTEQAVDGVVIIFEAHLLDDAEIDLPAGLPVVVISSNVSSSYAVVDVDQMQGARLATQHLLDLGHETVWHVAGPSGSFSAASREQSWRSTLENRGALVPPPVHGDWTAASGYQLGLELSRRESVTAVFAANDQMALGLLSAFHERDVRVPDDVSVVGFDDSEESRSFWPPLTTVHQDFAEVGRKSIESLIRQIDDQDDTPGAVVVPTRLVVRSSTAPPGPSRAR